MKVPKIVGKAIAGFSRRPSCRCWEISRRCWPRFSTRWEDPGHRGARKLLDAPERTPGLQHGDACTRAHPAGRPCRQCRLRQSRAGGGGALPRERGRPGGSMASESLRGAGHSARPELRHLHRQRVASPCSLHALADHLDLDIPDPAYRRHGRRNGWNRRPPIDGVFALAYGAGDASVARALCDGGTAAGEAADGGRGERHGRKAPAGR